MANPQQYAPPPPQYQAPAPKQGLSITAMVVGIVGAVFSWVPFLGLILGIIAATFGGVALYQGKQGKQGGKGMAIAGLVLGIFAIALFVTFLIIGVTVG